MTRHKRIHTIGVVIRFCTLALAGLLFADFLLRDRTAAVASKICAGGLFAAFSVLLIGPWSRFARLRRRTFLLCCGLFIAGALLEAYVRTFDPYPIVVQGTQINLPIHEKKVIGGHNVEGLDDEIRVSFNSLGFRGPEPPADWDSHLTILCVGGSTTHCYLLSDGRTWPDRLAKELTPQFQRVWVNNAGLDGQSTFGHLHLVDQYISALKPRVILLYVGINDVDRRDLNQYDRATRRTWGYEGESLVHAAHRQLLRHSHAYALIDNFRRHRMAARRGLTHQVGIGHSGLSNLRSIHLSDEERAQRLQAHDQQSLAAYRRRLTRLIGRCRDLGARVVLITQPALYGAGTDDLLGIDLERVQIAGADGWTAWRLLQKYNQATTEVGRRLRVPVIPVAERMPKSSRYYYDWVHYTNDGAEMLATLIAAELSPILRKWYPELSAAGRE